jgi:hypothetical protein
VKPTDAERDPAFDRLIARGLEGATDRSGKACPDADLLAAWFDRSLSAAEAERIEAHASSCQPCQQILADLARSEPAVVRAAPVPELARPWHWHWRWLVPAITAVVVIVVVGNRTLRAPQPLTIAARRPVPQAAAQGPTVPATGEDRPAAPPMTAPVQQASAKDAVATGTIASSAERKAVVARADVAPSGVNVAGRVQGEPVAAPQAPPPQPKAEETLGFAAARPAAQKPAEVAARAEPDAVRETVSVAQPTALPAASAGQAGTSAVKAVAMKTEDRSATGEGVAASPTAATAWRVGPAGRIERSTDRGATWQTQASGVMTDLAAASAVDDASCWVVGSGGVVLRTIDGTTWQRLPSPAALDLRYVRASSREAAVVRAADRSEYVTSDGGKTWTKR